MAGEFVSYPHFEHYQATDNTYFSSLIMHAKDGVLANQSLQVIDLRATRADMRRAGRDEKLHGSSFSSSC